MSYASDSDDAEQASQAEAHAKVNEPPSDFELMLRNYGCDMEDWEFMSNREKTNMKWNWKHVQKRGTA